MTTALHGILLDRIAAQGPLSLAEYMAECLLNPVHGYYTTGTPLGAKGDFTTAPEISQMFGELVGLALAQAWIDQGRPDPFCLAELGPGRGTLMADLLRATRAIPGFHEAAQLNLVELSPRLRQRQAETLAPRQPTWRDDVHTLPELPLFLIANEFFDALPIRQFQRDGANWRERLVGARNNDLAFGLGGPISPPELEKRLTDTKQGEIVEHCPAAVKIMTAIAERLDRHGGAALVIDYGGWRSLGDTFQALSNHQPVDALTQPGRADLTAHVDFETLSMAATAASEGLWVSDMTSQGAFLERLGITARAKILCGNLKGDARDTHIAAHRRLTHPDEMGTLFKVMGFAPAPAQKIAGLQQ